MIPPGRSGRIMMGQRPKGGNRNLGPPDRLAASWHRISLPAGRKFDFTPRFSPDARQKTTSGQRLACPSGAASRGPWQGIFCVEKKPQQGTGRGISQGLVSRLYARRRLRLTPVGDASPSSPKSYASILTPIWRRFHQSGGRQPRCSAVGGRKGSCPDAAVQPAKANHIRVYRARCRPRRSRLSAGWMGGRTLDRSTAVGRESQAYPAGPTPVRSPSAGWRNALNAFPPVYGAAVPINTARCPAFSGTGWRAAPCRSAADPLPDPSPLAGPARGEGKGGA